MRAVADRVRESITIDPHTHCWIWTRARNVSGYGRMRVGAGADRRFVQAHRASYEAFVGPIPAGMQLDHLCRNRPCVNPEHLEPVSGAENTRRAGSSPKAARASANMRLAKTHCPKGHPYEGNNVITKRGGRRQCRACTVASTRRWRALRAKEVAD